MSSKDIKRVHLVGIGGSGMTPLAEIAMQQGMQVSGSDRSRNHNCIRLEASGAKIFEQHSSQNIDSSVDLVVYSSAISKTNPELKEASKLGISSCHRSDFLKILIGVRKLIGVSGTHGKTSTTAIISHILNECGYEPSAFIGGEVIGRSSYSYTGNGEYFVAELDESDGSFLKFSPFISVVNNIDLDHLDFYDNIETIKQAFSDFIASTDTDGSQIINWDNPYCREISQDNPSDERLAFGKKIGCDVRGLEFKTDIKGSRFKAVVERDLVEGIVPLIGDHNFQNILCALSVARALEIPIQEACESLSSYQGVKRRLHQHYVSEKYRVYDDYAHNPGKISACIGAVKQSHPGAHLCVIFQPHRYSRMKTMYNEFVESFTFADTLILLPIFSAGESDCGTYKSESFSRDVKSSSPNIQIHRLDSPPIPSELIEQFSAHSKTVFLSIGAGDVYQVSHNLRDYLNGKEEQDQGEHP